MQTLPYDILIVGGGITGLTLACALAQRTALTIAVLEANAKQEAWSSMHYHPRVSAITLASKRIFQRLHIWDEIKKKRVSPFTHINVWDDKGQGNIQFDSKEIASRVLGYIIE